MLCSHHLFARVGKIPLSKKQGHKMHEAIYERLKQVARDQTIITYSEIAPLAGLNMSSPADRSRSSRILGEISTYEQEQGRPMLSAVVVLREKKLPGEGFFRLAKELGLFTEEDKLAFFCHELTEVYRVWRPPDR